MLIYKIKNMIYKRRITKKSGIELEKHTDAIAWGYKYSKDNELSEWYALYTKGDVISFIMANQMYTPVAGEVVPMETHMYYDKKLALDNYARHALITGGILPETASQPVSVYGIICRWGQK